MRWVKNLEFQKVLFICVQRVIDALVNIRTKYIAWPSEEHCRTIEEEFRKFAVVLEVWLEQ